MDADERPNSDGLDVIIVGAGAAGLSAALVLGRAKWRVAVVSAGRRRNDSASRVYNIPYAHGVTPAELYAKMQADVRGCGVALVEDEAVSAVAGEHGVEVETKGFGRLRGRRLLLALGTATRLPAWVPADEWGASVFDCPYCHAADFDGGRFVVVGSGMEVLGYALLCQKFAASLTALVTDPEAFGGEAAARLRKCGADVALDRIASARRDARDGGLELRTEGGRTLGADVVLIDDVHEPRRALPASLGLELDPQGFVRTDLAGHTSRRFVYHVGHSSNLPYVMWTGMAYHGITAARAICEDLAFAGPDEA